MSILEVEPYITEKNLSSFHEPLWVS